ncbi:MAG TPA: acetyl-CoA carboxylase biotin carboxyl carrier protein subunit [Burkholderiaceae bacterium]|jgi:acetyl-CoA carboxylase biotin carboxyl carrier protein|nr:acetyl-CoA carboxylase biotin carboxyl carrier protein subunit [Burkholderiaceae bacterium]
MDALARFQQLAAWLADTDVALLELRGPQTFLRLVRDGATGDVVEDHAEEQARPSTTVVPASTVGIVRHRHPLRDEPLAPVGIRVQVGQPLALLQIGQMLIAVPAPCDGVVARLIARDGDAVGYGDPLIELQD